METDNKAWTYDDLLQLPDDGTRYEIIDGELLIMPASSLTHQSVLGNLYSLFRAGLQERNIARVFMAPLDVILSRTRVVEPDLIVVRTERREILRPRGVEGIPDLVIEIVSPSSTKHDHVVKRRFYARCKVPEYWIVDPSAQTIEVLELIDRGLSYRQHGWYGPGDRARSATFDFDVDVDLTFREDN